MDIDGTLIERSLEQWFLQYLIRTGKIRPGRILAQLFRSALKIPPSAWLHLKLIYLAGQSTDDVGTWIDQCWEDTMKHHLRPESLKIVRWFQSRGDRLVLLSGTPRPLAQPLLRLLQINEIICAEPAIESGKLTGELNGLHPRGQRKVTAAANWLREHGCHWDQTAALANHWDDRFLLDSVKLPIAVFPDRRLRKYAHRFQWPIVDADTHFQKLVAQLEKNSVLVAG
ncbi:MAG: HAD family hydrolase [Candidatus Zhuqueibacterota bacterium]